jgi:hypothetical protein
VAESRARTSGAKWPFFVSLVFFLVGGPLLILIAGHALTFATALGVLVAYLLGGLPALLFLYAAQRKR